MAGEIRAIGSGASDKELFHKKDACVGAFFDAFGCSGRGKGAPYCAALPQEAAKTSIYSGGESVFWCWGKCVRTGH